MGERRARKLETKEERVRRVLTGTQDVEQIKFGPVLKYTAYSIMIYCKHFTDEVYWGQVTNVYADKDVLFCGVHCTSHAL